MLPTPDLAHLSSRDFECVYEPAEDTFLMLDALQEDLESLVAMKPLLGLEVGSGSGCVITFLSRILRPHGIACLATDLNPSATRATLRTAERNLSSVDALLTSLSNGLHTRRGLFDVILFNPPYVPTESVSPLAANPNRESIHQCRPEDLLEASWTGGPDGRYWIDRLLPRIDALLSRDGVFYMIALEANRPAEVMKWAQDDWNLASRILLKRKAGIETLSVIKFWRHR